MKVSTDKEIDKDFWDHHKGYNDGPISEPDTYDWDDDTNSDGGPISKEKDDEKTGWEPVEEDLNEINLKKILAKLKIPSSIIKNPSKLTTFLQQNPVILTQVFKLLGEDVNVVKKDGKDSGDYRTYTKEKDSDVDEPYKSIRREL